MKDSHPPDETEIARRLVESRALQEAPEDLVLKVIAMWDRRPQQKIPPRVLVAILRFDSLLSSSPLPSTRATEEARHLLFSVDGRDVELRVQASRDVAMVGWSVAGQVLGPEEPGSASIRCGAFEAQLRWTAHGEFHFEPVPEGECIISLYTDEWQAELPALMLTPAM